MHLSRAHRGTKGFTLLELVVVICIISTLGAFLANRLQSTAELAEKTSMEYIANEISTALLFEFANNMVRGTQGKIPGMMQTNPMDWLVQKPANYLGEFADAPSGEDQLGNWYYDTRDHVLVYLVRRGDYFHPDSTGAKRVRYRVKVLFDTDEPRAVVGVILSPVEPYKWF